MATSGDSDEEERDGVDDFVDVVGVDDSDGIDGVVTS